MSFAHGSAPHGAAAALPRGTTAAVESPPPGLVVDTARPGDAPGDAAGYAFARPAARYSLPDPRGRTFFAVELEVFAPGSPEQVFQLPHGARPHGALSRAAHRPESTETLRASDAGYRTRETDPGGLQVYPGVLDAAFEMDRRVSLDPATASAAGFGAVRLLNAGRRYDAFALTRNSDSRPIRLLHGRKTFDPRRGILLDPPYGDLVPFFAGTATPWSLSEAELEIPVRDPSHFLDRAVQADSYAGTGRLDGTKELVGKPKPFARGGTASAPVLNVPLVQVDPVSLVFQWTDGPGSVVKLYEGGREVFAADGDVPDLYAGAAPAPGHYRTDNARGVLQLGSRPVRALTADVTGAWPVAGAMSTAARMALAVLEETMALPAAMLDRASFLALDAAYPYVAGVWLDAETTGADLAHSLLGSIGARMLPGRDGRMVAHPLRALGTGVRPRGKWTPRELVDLAPQPLPATLDPPPVRWRVGYGRNHTVQASDLNPALDAARQQFLAEEYRFASWSSAEVARAWRRPTDPPPLGTHLLVQQQAQALADALGALWGPRPRLYAAELPVSIAAAFDLGDVVVLQFPLNDLGEGKLGQIVGEQTRSFDGTSILSVLV